MQTAKQTQETCQELTDTSISCRHFPGKLPIFTTFCVTRWCKKNQTNCFIL